MLLQLPQRLQKPSAYPQVTAPGPVDYGPNQSVLAAQWENKGCAEDSHGGMSRCPKITVLRELLCQRDCGYQRGREGVELWESQGASAEARDALCHGEGSDPAQPPEEAAGRSWQHPWFQSQEGGHMGATRGRAL